MLAQQYAQQYKQQEILSATPEELILKLYELGLQACARQDREKLRGVLRELINSLDFTYAEQAQTLFHLYMYCLHQTHQGRYEAVRDILTELRETWRTHVLGK
ncbi:MAG: flagellar protein FliS [Bacteroidetes bacterium]|nr:flagellar protein FliS [Rhodothermia bacterium]MCS7156090.1 flagellar protein FliS [Bacteroidota bacterium]MCX7907778.1 flagellar protein FliS [Bacteroidota bacterium]MDW8137907.1 flagellar export chaperone FliS [Bacteroidota bacterium]MDW8286242.1 flagellar export chaperone FliS [Bacteroidota bacterium]